MKYKNLFLYILCLILLSACSSGTNEGADKQDESELSMAVDITLSEEQLKKVKDILVFLPDYNNLYDEKLEIKDLSNTEKIEMMFQFDRSGNNTGKKVNEWLTKYFGENGKAEMENIICSHDDKVVYIYNSNTDKFEDANHLGHGYSTVIVYRKILNTKKYEDKYFVEVVKAFSEGFDITTGDFTTLYKTAQDGWMQENPTLENLGDTKYCTLDNYGDASCDYDTILTENQDKFNTYTYTFVEKDGELYFDSYEIKK